MFGRKQQKDASSQRSGLPLARAQRLRAQTEQIGRKGGNRVATVSLLAIGSVVFFGAHPTAGARVQTAITAAGDGAPIADVVAHLTEPMAEPAAYDIPGHDAAPEIADTADDEPTAAPLFVAATDTPTCIAEIEQALEAVVAQAAPYPVWSDSEDQVSAIVQSGLACPEAGVRMSGSLELASTGFADLHLHWDRESWLIDLSTVESAEAQANDIIATDTSLDLVFR